MARCFKYNKECNPRKCNDVCYIKDKRDDVLKFFNSNIISERQQEVNNYALDVYREISNALLDEVVEMVFNKTKMYPNIEVIKLIRDNINRVDSL